MSTEELQVCLLAPVSLVLLFRRSISFTIHTTVKQLIIKKTCITDRHTILVQFSLTLMFCPSPPQAQLAEKTSLLSEARLKEQGFVETVSVGPRVCTSRGQVNSKSHAAYSHVSVACSKSSYCSPAAPT